MSRVKSIFVTLIVLMLVLSVVGPATAGAPPYAGAPQADPWVKHYQSEWGYILTDGKGWILYSYAKDKPGESSCYDVCAQVWQPYLVVYGAKQQADWTDSFTLGTTKRTDGNYQFTYNDIPLYYYAQDEKAGDAYGNGYGGVWSVVPIKYTGNGAAPVAPAPPYTAGPQANPWVKHYQSQWGYILTDGNGWILYSYAKDKPGESYCYDTRAQAWYPYLVAYGAKLQADWTDSFALGTIQRTDGNYQFTYNNIPLYYYVQDAKPGDVYGNGYGGVWSVTPIQYTPPPPPQQYPTPPYQEPYPTPKGY